MGMSEAFRRYQNRANTCIFLPATGMVGLCITLWTKADSAVKSLICTESMSGAGDFIDVNPVKNNFSIFQKCCDSSDRNAIDYGCVLLLTATPAKQLTTLSTYTVIRSY